MTILVTGADGYIGTVLCPRLLERGYEVVGIDSGFYRRGWLFEDGRTRPMIISRDIRHLTAHDLRGFRAVIHLAELSSDLLGESEPEIAIEVNHRGSVAFARACKSAGVSRFIYSSSCGVYGADGVDIKTEESQLDPRTVHTRCKVLNESEILKLRDDQFAPIVLRNATAFGASPRQRFDLVLNNFAAWACTTREIPLTTDGSSWRSLVHIDDICEAMLCALEAPCEAVTGQAFNVGDDSHNLHIADIAEIVRTAFPGSQVRLQQHRSENRGYRVSFAKIRTHMPAFRCRWTPARGAAELHRIFDRIGLDLATFQAAQFSRLAELEYLQSTRQVDDHLFWTKASLQPANAIEQFAV